MVGCDMILLIQPRIFNILDMTQIWRFFINFFRSDTNLAIFLEYEKELNVRGKNKKEKLVGFFSSFQVYF